jgi:hypothetical protein
MLVLAYPINTIDNIAIRKEVLKCRVIGGVHLLLTLMQPWPLHLSLSPCWLYPVEIDDQPELVEVSPRQMTGFLMRSSSATI